jgi:hypothetical protein|tara:strand:- start:2611 stop:3072 length:462 start_codon:yes stop_codon:yes gene_type:complete
MKIKKIILILMMFVTTGCGYQAIYATNDKINYSISEIIETGDKKVNRKIKSKINLKKKDSLTKYILIINSKKNNEVVGKDGSGNTIVNKISIEVNVILTDSSDTSLIIKEKNFEASFTYNNTGSKFELAQYISIRETNLIDQIQEDIMFFLNS